MQGLTLALTWIAVLAAVGCAGQSGSEAVPPRNPMGPLAPGEPGAPPQPHCPCDGYSQSLMVRAQVVGVQAFPQIATYRYELEAREILGPDPLGRDDLHVADHFGGYWGGRLGCGGSLEPAKVGDEVLAFYRRGHQDGLECCEYIACTDPCVGEHVEDCRTMCEATTRDACALHSNEAVMHGELMLIPWGDQLVVGKSPAGSVSIDQSQIASLGKPQAVCMSELPDLFEMLYPPERSESAPAAGSGATSRAQAPQSSPTPGASPMAPQAAPPNSASTPLPPVTTNATGTATPPPAGPEEVRVRCAK